MMMRYEAILIPCLHAEVALLTHLLCLSCLISQQEGSEPNWVTVNRTVWNWNWPNQRPKWNRWNRNQTEPEPSEPDLGVGIGAGKLNYGLEYLKEHGGYPE